MCLQLVEAGHLFQRISMPDEIDFVISRIRAPDAGTYLCTIQYPSIATRTTVQRSVAVVGILEMCSIIVI